MTTTQCAAVNANAKHGAMDACDSAEILQTVVSSVEQDDAAPEQDVANVEHDTCDSSRNPSSVSTDCHSEAIVFNVVRQTYTSSNECRWADMVEEDDADFDFLLSSEAWRSPDIHSHQKHIASITSTETSCGFAKAVISKRKTSVKFGSTVVSLTNSHVDEHSHIADWLHLNHQCAY